MSDLKMYICRYVEPNELNPRTKYRIIHLEEWSGKLFIMEVIE